MRIILASALYPPDIAEPAPYIKELAKRLKDRHEVTIVTYGRLPEMIPGVQIVAIDKGQSLPFRLFHYTFALFRALQGGDILYAENGPSVELPLIISAVFGRARVILHIGDRAAHERAKDKTFFGLLEYAARKSATSVLYGIPPARPEILPFRPKPEDKWREYEKTWALHQEELEHIFHYGH